MFHKEPQSDQAVRNRRHSAAAKKMWRSRKRLENTRAAAGEADSPDGADLPEALRSAPPAQTPLLPSPVNSAGVPNKGEDNGTLHSDLMLRERAAREVC